MVCSRTPMAKLPRPSNWAGEMPRKSRMRGRAMETRRSIISYMRSPRIRDFRGISPAQFDGRGNFAMGVREQTIFPEIDYDSVEQFRGLNVVITTTAKTDEERRALLSKLVMPFRSNYEHLKHG